MNSYEETMDALLRAAGPMVTVVVTPRAGAIDAVVEPWRGRPADELGLGGQHMRDLGDWDEQAPWPLEPQGATP